MEMVSQYMIIWRKDPVKMRDTIRQVKEDIDKIIENYSGNLRITYTLKKDITSYIQHYLINKGVYDLFTFELNTEEQLYGSSVLVANVKFNNQKRENYKERKGVEKE